MPKPLVIQTEHLDAEAAAWLAERAELVVCPSENEPRFSELLARAEGLVIRTYTRVNDELLARAPNLRVVARAGVGLDNVDVEACRRRSIAVLNTPDANTRAVVEFVTCFMLDTLRPRTYLDRPLDAKTWKSLRSEMIAPRQLSGLILGILGLGRIGKQVARVGAAFNMRVFYYDIVEIPEEEREGALWLPRAALFRNADVISIHVDGRPENRRIIDAPTLAECKPDVLFINTSRGFVVDNLALADFLRANPGATAALDVHEPEPFGPDYPLLGLPNARLTPHLASATRIAHQNMSWVVKDLWAVLRPRETREEDEYA